MRYLIVVMLLVCASITAQSTLTGSQLLDKAIAYHDPMNKWPTFEGEMKVTMETDAGPDRVSKIKIDLPSEYFAISYQSKDNQTLEYVLQEDNSSHRLDGSKDISMADREKHKLTDQRAKLWRNYYTYLYGLPMKLKDSGTIIDPVTENRVFKEKEYLVLKATYESSVRQRHVVFLF